MNIDISYIFPASIAALICFGFTFTILYLAKRGSKKVNDTKPSFMESWKFSLSKNALLGVGVMPALNIVVCYGFIMHVRWSLGRWPHFGEELTQPALSLHIKFAEYCVLGLFFALYAIGIMTLFGFAFKSLRWLSFSGLLHMLLVALSLGSLFLAPHEFLNWLFD